MNIEIFGNLLLLYARRYIYKNRITHPPIHTSPLTPLFPVFPTTLTPPKPSNKLLSITYTPLLQYIIYIIAIPYTIYHNFTYKPQISILNPFNHPIDLHYKTHNKNRSERKPELPSFTINHFLILIINFSLRLVHPVAAVLPIQIQTYNKIINNNIKPL